MNKQEISKLFQLKLAIQDLENKRNKAQQDLTKAREILRSSSQQISILTKRLIESIK